MLKIISFPYIGYYNRIFSYFLSKMTKCKILIPKQMTEETLMLGEKSFKKYACPLFKYTIGSYIESLGEGATVLIHLGNECSHGYYADLEEKVLRSTGYDFIFYSVVKDNHLSLLKLYHFCKKMNPKANFLMYLYYLLSSFLKIIFIDNIQKYIRLNMGFVKEKENFIKLEQEYLASLHSSGVIKSFYFYIKYRKKIHSININKDTNSIKVMLVGEPSSFINKGFSCDIERKMINMGIEVHRQVDLAYIIRKQIFKRINISNKWRKYIKYDIGLFATTSVIDTLNAVKNNFDGIIHLKNSSCFPEMVSSAVISKINSDFSLPILTFNLDDKNFKTDSEEKLNKFYNDIKEKKNASINIK